VNKKTPQKGLEIVWQTDRGQLRDHNEDCVAGDDTACIVVLADGMGGYQAGEVASEIAVASVMQHMQATDMQSLSNQLDKHTGYKKVTLLLQQAISQANLQIYTTAQSQAEYHGMGTTLVAAILHDDVLSVAHVGDSRLYRLRGNLFEQLTLDHSVLQELIDHGLCTPEQARHSPNRNLVTRALGVGMDVNVDVNEYPVKQDDVYLLCSDGLSDMLEDTEIQKILRDNRHDLRQAANELVLAANDSGGFDNISVILTRPMNLADHNPKNWQTLMKKIFKGN
jgi:protein phosphatase